MTLSYAFRQGSATTRRSPEQRRQVKRPKKAPAWPHAAFAGTADHAWPAVAVAACPGEQR